MGYRHYLYSVPKKQVAEIQECKTHKDWIATDVTITSSDNTSRVDSLKTIHDLCIDYDGFNTVDGLKSLIDDIRAITEETLK